LEIKVLLNLRQISDRTSQTMPSFLNQRPFGYGCLGKLALFAVGIRLDT